jgi:hypothetical protein
MSRTFPCALVVLVLLRAEAACQEPLRVFDHNFHGWYMYFGDHPIGGPWGIHLEGQWRRHDALLRWQQLLLRPGLNYQVNPHLLLTAGYGYVNTSRYGEFPVSAPFPEHRLFQQALLRHEAGRLAFQHRYRLEQRFLGEVSDGPEGRRVDRWRHENRFRYMMRTAIPLPGNWYLAFYDEIFVNFGENVAANVFDQNRAYAALGRHAGKIGRLEFGFLNQLLQQRNGRVFESNHTLQVALYSTLPFGRK